jgi:hypothetical protein
MGVEAASRAAAEGTGATGTVTAADALAVDKSRCEVAVLDAVGELLASYRGPCLHPG